MTDPSIGAQHRYHFRILPWQHHQSSQPAPTSVRTIPYFGARLGTIPYFGARLRTIRLLGARLRDSDRREPSTDAPILGHHESFATRCAMATHLGAASAQCQVAMGIQPAIVRHYTLVLFIRKKLKAIYNSMVTVGHPIPVGQAFWTANAVRYNL